MGVKNEFSVKGIERHEKLVYRDDLSTRLTTLVEKLEGQLEPFRHNLGPKIKPKVHIKQSRIHE